jgi:predicted ribosome quality control (RQC) complex YloA/Tae2 family protein
MYTEIFNGDYQIKVGHNQNENDILIRSAPQTALWFHLKDFPSAHAILTKINTTTTRQSNQAKYETIAIFRAASLVKIHAKNGVNNLQKLSINYLPIKNVKRTETPGKVIMIKSPKTIQI